MFIDFMNKLQNLKEKRSLKIVLFIVNWVPIVLLQGRLLKMHQLEKYLERVRLGTVYNIIFIMNLNIQIKNKGLKYPK